VICALCGFAAASLDDAAILEHIATEHAEAWAMAIDVACMEAVVDGRFWPVDE
jgi:hypothetical protein